MDEYRWGEIILKAETKYFVRELIEAWERKTSRSVKELQEKRFRGQHPRFPRELEETREEMKFYQMMLKYMDLYL